jgi:hypothetical protein
MYLAVLSSGPRVALPGGRLGRRPPQPSSGPSRAPVRSGRRRSSTPEAWRRARTVAAGLLLPPFLSPTRLLGVLDWCWFPARFFTRGLGRRLLRHRGRRILPPQPGSALPRPDRLSPAQICSPGGLPAWGGGRGLGRRLSQSGCGLIQHPPPRLAPPGILCRRGTVGCSPASTGFGGGSLVRGTLRAWWAGNGCGSGCLPWPSWSRPVLLRWIRCADGGGS